MRCSTAILVFLVSAVIAAPTPGDSDGVAKRSADVGGLVNGLTGTVGSVVGGVTGAVGNVVDGVTGTDAVGNLLGGVTGTVGGVVSGVGNAAGSVVDGVTGSVGLKRDARRGAFRRRLDARHFEADSEELA